jgi:A/G-specific adenine glycosylase
MKMIKSHVLPFNPSEFQRKILEWYAVNQRILPWRVKGGGKTDPYKVWLSEIMLQQTTVPAVIPYFLKFTEKWPNVESLAKAKDDEIMGDWAGLGYYARARNLLKCARVISQDYNGVFPRDFSELKKLPGVGPYTASAISAIAYGVNVPVVDGNIERITARIFMLSHPIPSQKKQIVVQAEQLFLGLESYGQKSVRQFPQALMDLANSVCTPKNPKCNICPIQKFCFGYDSGKPDDYPVRDVKTKKPHRLGHVYWIQDKQGNVLFEKRDEKRMLGGMLGLPTSEWDKPSQASQNIEKQVIKDVKNLKKIGGVNHVFTHFSLELCVWGTIVPDINKFLHFSDTAISKNVLESSLKNLGLPSLFMKVSKMAHRYFNKGD